MTVVPIVFGALGTNPETLTKNESNLDNVTSENRLNTGEKVRVLRQLVTWPLV